MENKRRSKRLAISIPAEFRGNRVWQVKTTVNISAGGMFIATNNVEPAGALIEVIFDPGKKETKPICAQAVVVWSHVQAQKIGGENIPAGMGLRFIKIFPADGKEFLESLE